MSQPVTQLIITLDENGSVDVSGPLQDKMTCYALLEAARDAIKDYTDAQRPKILPPDPADMMKLMSRKTQ